MNIKDILNENKFVFKKKYGQNFLVDNNVLDNIIREANILPNDLVIEIGVGAAALTKKSAVFAKNVLGYEIDKSLKKSLDKILDNYDNVRIIYDDFLRRNIKEDIKNYNYDRIIVVANLPYYITTPIITKFIDEKIDVKRIIVMVQNEVAERFSAKPRTKDYNSLTIFLNYYFDIRKAFFVSRNVFYPKPNVDSAIVVFDKKVNLIYLKDEKTFFELVRQSFKQKRKTLKNNLKNYDLDKIEFVLSKYGKSINSRAEEITIEEFVDISNNLN